MAAKMARNAAAGYNSIDACIRSGYTRPWVSRERFPDIGVSSAGRLRSCARTHGMKT
jgi:hypothetical protein